MHNPVLFSKILTCKSTTFDLTECASGVCLCVRGRGVNRNFFSRKPLAYQRIRIRRVETKSVVGAISKIGNEPKVFFFMVSWADEVPKKVNQRKTYHFQWKVYEREGKEWLMNSYLSIIV